MILAVKRNKKQEKQYRNDRKDQLRIIVESVFSNTPILNNLDLLQEHTSSTTIITLNSNLTSQERRFVHGIAAAIEIYHWSTGEGNQRHICLSLTQPPPTSSESISSISKPQEQFQIYKPDTHSYYDDPKFLLPHSHLNPIQNLIQNIPFQASHIKNKIKNTVPVQSSQLLSNTPFVFVNTIEMLATTVSELSSTTEFAVDLEMNNTRSYNGMTCLIQLSSRDKDYIIDVLALWDHIHTHLSNLFSNPNIIKVFHACSGGDVPALDRDFKIKVVNIFDTQQAAKVLEGTQLSLEYMLTKYLTIKDNEITNEKIQELKSIWTCSDWRQRPLHTDALLYARMDTHYLLELKDRLIQELCGIHSQETQNDMDAMLVAAAAFGSNTLQETKSNTFVVPNYSSDEDTDNDTNNSNGNKTNETNEALVGSADVEEDELCHCLYLSHKCSLKKFRSKKHPMQLLKKDKSYKRMKKKWKRKKEGKEILYQSLFVWRDTLAREKDESSHYVCPSEILIKITNNTPKNSDELIQLWNPLPPLLLNVEIQTSLFEVIALWDDATNPTGDCNEMATTKEMKETKDV